MACQWGKEPRVKPTFAKQLLRATCCAWPCTDILSIREAVLLGDFGLQVKENPSKTILSKTELELAQAKQTQKECMGSTTKRKGWLQEQLDSGTSVESPRSDWFSVSQPCLPLLWLCSQCVGVDQHGGPSSLSLSLRSTGDEDLSTSSSLPASVSPLSTSRWVAHPPRPSAHVQEHMLCSWTQRLHRACGQSWGTHGSPGGCRCEEW